MKQRICVEINGVFYDSIQGAEIGFGETMFIIKSKCLSKDFPNYNIVPFRITYIEKRCTKCGEIKLLKEFWNKPSAEMDFCRGANNAA